METRYNSEFTGFSEFRCPDCFGKAVSTVGVHQNGCASKEVVYIFGPRMAQAILLAVLKNEEPEDLLVVGFPYSWAGLGERFPEAAEETLKNPVIKQVIEDKTTGKTGSPKERLKQLLEERKIRREKVSEKTVLAKESWQRRRERAATKTASAKQTAPLPKKPPHSVRFPLQSQRLAQGDRSSFATSFRPRGRDLW